MSGRKGLSGAHRASAGMGRLHRGRVWRRADPTIVGRFDLAYDGNSPPKMLEYNADTPTALYEAAVVQWYWLKDVKPEADQFNSIHERLIDAWRGILRGCPPEALVHFARFRGPSRGSRDPRNTCATPPCRPACRQAAGGAADRLEGRHFTDPDEMPIQVMGKLYAWEWMAREEFGAHVLTDTTAFLGPAWKMILSEQDAAAALVGGFPGPREPAAGFRYRACRSRRRPCQEADLRPRGPQRHPGRTRLVRHRGRRATVTKAMSAQAYQPLPVFDGNHAVVGSWVVEGKAGRHGHAGGRAARQPQQQPIRATLVRGGREPVSEVWIQPTGGALGADVHGVDCPSR